MPAGQARDDVGGAAHGGVRISHGKGEGDAAHHGPIRQVIAHKEENAPAYYPYVTFDQYDKIRVLADRPPRVITDGKLFKRYHFLFTPDTTLVPGKSLVPAYLEETLTRNYSRTNPGRSPSAYSR